MQQMRRKPEWLRKPFVTDDNQIEVGRILAELGLNTVCHEALCPNMRECFARKTATFLILGPICTRDCRFCNVRCGAPAPVDAGEPARVAEAVARLGLKYAVVTSVTRDDLDDGGAAHFAATINAMRRAAPATAIEVLIPDFQGSEQALARVVKAAPDVVSHNIETVPALYGAVRPQADYARSLRLLERIKEYGAGVKSKTSLMLGLGETERQVIDCLRDIRARGCDFLTLGQYLAPSKTHFPVAEYIHPDKFQSYKTAAEAEGFAFVASAPYVRSSYNAGEALSGA